MAKLSKAAVAKAKIASKKAPKLKRDFDSLYVRDAEKNLLDWRQKGVLVNGKTQELSERQEKLWTNIKNAYRAGCTSVEVAARIGVSIDTLKRGVKKRFNITLSEYRAEYMAIGDGDIRVKQYEGAVLRNNVQLLMFLGKNRLDQSDKTESRNLNVDIKPPMSLSDAQRERVYADLDRMLDAQSCTKDVDDV